MNSGNKKLGLILILCGLLFNPWFLEKLFSNDGNITSSALLIAALSTNLLFVLFGITLYRSPNERVGNMGISLLTIVFIVVLSVSADRFYGQFLMPEMRSFVYPPYSRVTHTTSEFTSETRINNLGFRGPCTSIKKERKRVLVIGDSFTFGWGVSQKQTWIHLLSEKYGDIEFLNLGQGGTHQGDHVNTLRNCIEELKPDVVIATILQGNDIHQLMRIIEREERGVQTTVSKISNAEHWQIRINQILQNVYPHFRTRFKTKANTTNQWREEVDIIQKSLTPSQKNKYESLSQDVRKAFEQGTLNPSLVLEGLRHPKMYINGVDTSNTVCGKAIIRLRDLLIQMKELTNKNDCDLLLVSIPCRPYGFPSSLMPLTDLGFKVEGADTLNAQLPIELAVNQTGIPLASPFMQGNCQETFYHYDGHWNAAGNRIFAESLQAQLDTNKTWKHLLTL